MPSTIRTFNKSNIIHFKAPIRKSDFDSQDPLGGMKPVEYIDLNGNGELDFVNLKGNLSSEPVLLKSLKTMGQYHNSSKNTVLSGGDLRDEEVGKLWKMFDDDQVQVIRSMTFNQLAQLQVPPVASRIAALDIRKGEFVVYSAKPEAPEA